MSYDLFFYPRQQDARLNITTVKEFFQQRRKYEISEQQAIYQNQDTGVYFIFDFDATEGEQSSEAVHFILNYFRPHVFGLEADVELTALVREFNLLAGDCQGEMSDGEYSSERFLGGWNAGNEFGYRAMLSEELSEPIFTAPAVEIEAAWRWNFTKPALQEHLGEDVFVPTIMWMARGDSVETMIVWGDGYPVAMPMVDNIIIARKELAPKKLLGTEQDYSLVAGSEIEPTLSEFPVERAPLDYRLLRYNEIPPHIIEFIKNRASTAAPDIVPLETVLDLELVEKAKGER